jgi:FkbM family methyltransferase
MKMLTKVLSVVFLIAVGVLIGKYASIPSGLIAEGTASQPQEEIFVGALVRDYNQTLPLFLRSIENQDYDKSLLTLQFNFCSDSDAFKTSKALVSDWIDKVGSQYKKVILVDNTSQFNKAASEMDRRVLFGQVKETYLKNALKGNYDHCLILSSENFIEPKTLKALLGKDVPIIAPLLRPMPEAHDPYRNFFPDVTETGYFNLHPDYFPIAFREKLGTFKLPCVQAVYLIKADALDKLSFIDNFNGWEFITFYNNARNNGVDQYLCNEQEFGFLLHFPEEENTEKRKEFTLVGSELEVTPQLLKTIFSPYYANDPTIKAHVEKFNFDDYAIFRVLNRDLFYVDDVNDFIKNRVIKRGGTWEEYIHDQFKKYVKPGSVALDIGGHIGTHTLNLSRLVGDNGQVYVFEPQPKMFCELVINMHLNGRKNIKFFHNALGAEEKWIKMHIPPEAWTAIYGSTLINEGHGTVSLDTEVSGDPAKMIRLDDLHIDNISVIKMDVEGFEMEVIRGGKETILRNKPVLIIEIFKDDYTLDRIKEIVSMGYVASFIGLDNYLFLPSEMAPPPATAPIVHNDKSFNTKKLVKDLETAMNKVPKKKNKKTKTK